MSVIIASERVPKFTASHYEKIAEVLKRARPYKRNQHDHAYYERNAQWIMTILEFKTMFAIDNPKFDIKKFENAIYSKE